MKTIFNRRLFKSEILHVIVLIALFAVAGYTIYQSQYRQVNSLADKNSKLDAANKAQEKQISELQSKSDSLSKQNVALQNQVATYKNVSSVVVPQPSYTAKVNSVKQYYPPALLADHTYTLLVIDVSITNTGSATGYVNPSDFIVKDSSSVSQQTLSQWYGRSQSAYLPPPQPTELGSQSLNAGDTVRGSIVFHTLTSQTSFTMTYNNQDIPISVDGQLTI